MRSSRVLIVGMCGLGDCINQRPVVLAAAQRNETYLVTPWPELYDGSPEVRCIRSKTRLRTQAKNEKVSAYDWYALPNRNFEAAFRIAYSLRGNLHEEFEHRIPIGPSQEWRYDLPRYALPAQAPTRPYAVLRPATIRAEWRADSRNPDPAYLSRAAEILRDRGLAVVLLADLEDEVEWLAGNKPEADVELLHGELGVREMLGLIQGAAVCVGGEGFLLPAAMASGTPVVIVYGGRMGYSHPRLTWPPRLPDAPAVAILPDTPCLCHDHRHACDRRISDFDGKFMHALDRLAAKRVGVAS